MNNRFGRFALCFALSLGSTSIAADTLRDIYELALKNDATLKAAEATYRADRESKNISRSALLPQVGAYADYSRRDTRDFSSRIQELPPGSPEQFLVFESKDDTEADSRTYGITLQQSLFDLPAWFSFRSGQSISEQAEAQLAAEQQDLIVRVAEAYFNVLRAHDNLSATRAEERAALRQLEQTQQRFDVGLIAITEVHEAQAIRDNTVVQRLTDEGNLGTALEGLSVLTGQQHSNLWLLQDDFPITAPDPQPRDQWVEFALSNNYSLKAAIHGMDAAQRTAQARTSEHLPKVTGSIDYRDYKEDGDNTSRDTGFVKPFETRSEGSTIGVQVNMPLFAGGGISAQRRQAHEQYNAALQRKIETQRRTIQQTRSLHLNVVTDVQRVAARQQSIVSAQSALDATQAGYEVGTRNIVDVLQAQRALFTAIRDYANARYDYILNMLRLKEQAGTLSPQDIFDLSLWLEQPDAPLASELYGQETRS